MNKCFITKLDAVVEDNHLPYLGYAVANVNLSAEKSMYFGVDTSVNSVKIKIVGNVSITSLGGVSTNVKEAQVSHGQSFILSPGTYQLLFDKYYAVPLSFPTDGSIRINAEDFSFSQYSRESSLSLIRIIYGDVKGMGSLYKAKTLNFQSCDKLYGDIADLGTCTGLTELWLNGTQVTGNIEDFVKAQRNAGRTSCDSLNIAYAAETLVKWKGNGVTTSVYQNKLSWTSNSITFKDETISA